MYDITELRPPLLRAEFLIDCQEDYCGVWDVYARVRSALGAGDSSESRDATLAVIHDFLESGLFRLGVADGRNFVPRIGSNEQLLNELTDEWNRLPGPPSVGDLCWLDLTEAGDEVATRLRGTWR